MDGPRVRERLRDAGILPVVTLETAERAADLASTLAGAGLGCIEIALRTAVAQSAIARAAGAAEVIVGAGTVRWPDQVRAVASAGARFIVTPGTNPSVIETCHELSLPVIPGVASPTEIEQAIELGCTLLKLFPAAPLGGPDLLRALAPVYPEVQFVPTGGVTEANAAEYLSLGNVVAVAGSWVTAGLLGPDADLPAVAARARRAVALVASLRAPAGGL